MAGVELASVIVREPNASHRRDRAGSLRSRRSRDGRDDWTQVHEPRQCDLLWRHVVPRCDIDEIRVPRQATHTVPAQRAIGDESDPVIATVLGDAVPQRLVVER